MGEAKRRRIQDPDVKKNRFGLTRNIPASVQREIRKRCGFGCVNCGLAIYHYEHIEPEFKDAREHDPARMALLCPSCHQKVTNKFWSKDKVKRALEKPKCLQQGFSFDTFDIGCEHPKVILGNTEISDTFTILEVSGEALLKIEPPEEAGGPFRLSAFFYDHLGKEILKIVQNQWQGSTTNWDIEIKGPKITIRNALKEITLVIRAEPPKKLVIERLNMFYKGVRVVASENSKETYWVSSDGCVISLKAPGIKMFVGASFPKGGGIRMSKL